ncbi:MAG: hypothetical protein Q8Q31_04465 [Nanoarchaeota archaeon]|nr:hypothetical protein [Nanoarchaeota archaeon]
MDDLKVSLEEENGRDEFSDSLLIDLAENIFRYKPGSFTERLSCFLAPFLSMPLRLKLANVSESIHYNDLVKRAYLRFQDGAALAVDDMLRLAPWERNGCMRSISRSIFGEEMYVLSSYQRL